MFVTAHAHVGVEAARSTTQMKTVHHVQTTTTRANAHRNLPERKKPTIAAQAYTQNVLVAFMLSLWLTLSLFWALLLLKRSGESSTLMKSRSPLGRPSCVDVLKSENREKSAEFGAETTVIATDEIW